MSGVNRDALSAWIDGHAVRLDPDTLAANEDGARRIDALLDRVERARVVVLGELDHWIAEKNDFRLWWLERLAARFPLMLAEELGHSDGVRVAAYLASGDASWLDRVPTFGWRGDARPDRDDRPTGVLRASFECYPTARFKAAQSAFYRGLRALGLHRFHGLDVNGVAGAGYADIASCLSRVAPALAATIERGLARVPGESDREEADRLAALRTRLEARAVRGEIEVILVHLRVMEDSLRYQALANPAPDYEALRPALAWREEMMKRAATRLLDGLGHDEKLVLMGHALHLARDDRRLDRDAGVGPGGNLVPSLGHYLARTRQEPVFAVWFVFGGGEDCQPFPDLPSTLRYGDQTLNAGLLRHGAPLVIDTAPAGEALADVGVGHLYGLVQRTDLAAQADAVFFLPRVRPLPPSEAVAPAP